MLMWTDVTAPQKKLPSGQHWMIYNLLKFACSVFQFDHHSAVQFLLRYLVHTNYNVSIPAKFSSINHTWSSKMLRCSLFKVLTCCVQWICCIPKSVTVQVSKKTDEYLSVHWIVWNAILLSSFFLELKFFFFCMKPLISGWFEEGAWIGSWASCSAAHGRWRGHGSCQEDCQSSRRIIVWQRAWKTNWAAYCHLWPEQNAKLLTAGTWMENTSKGII